MLLPDIGKYCQWIIFPQFFYRFSSALTSLVFHTDPVKTIGLHSVGVSPMSVLCFWWRQVSNPCPCHCNADVLPLHYFDPLTLCYFDPLFFKEPRAEMVNFVNYLIISSFIMMTHGESDFIDYPSYMKSSIRNRKSSMRVTMLP